jgi:acetoin utilization deacetylase AcuC-like enzyme/GNAT superfamily N-acetyltransferase
LIRVRKVLDDVAPANAAAVAEAQRILRAQFPELAPEEIDKLPEQLRNPLKFQFVSRLFVAEKAGGRILGVALLIHFPKQEFCYLELMSTAPGRTGGGVGSVLYDRVREEAAGLGAKGIYLEALPDDPALSPDERIRKQNAARLRFYERYGARPIANTAYETPLRPGQSDPPYLVFDPLDTGYLPSRERARRVIRAILEQKYGPVVPPGYVEMVVTSVKDDPVRLREPRYAQRRKAEQAPVTASHDRIALVVNHRHDIHHIHDRGYVEAPARVQAILAEIEPTGLFERIEPRRYADRHINEVHDRRLVDYLRRACREAGAKSLYPYVFPVRNASRAPKERSVLAGYYCIDTFTPLNENAWSAARLTVDCALTAAEQLLAGRRLAYALVRPPGHHAERRVFGGFCYFCNAAIAAHYLSRTGRVAILDIDYHHGNGQQDIFYERADVLTVSIHGDPSFAYPYFTGFRDETGARAGAGYNLNLPLPEKVTPEQHREAVRQGLRRIGRFRPAYLVVAAGFDTAKGDPTGTWSNGPDDFEALGRMIGAAGLPTLIVQEGGYRIRTLGGNARRFFIGLQEAAQRTAPASIAIAKLPRPRPVERHWRFAARREDIEKVRSLVAATGFFSAEEQAIAAELVAERVSRGAASGYHFIFAERDGRLDGYACFGPIAGTEDGWDLYWIAVHPDLQGRGLGREIIRRAEDLMERQGARAIYVDTAGREQYAPTRRFYREMGYREEAVLPDFYAAGDAKVIFAKPLRADRVASSLAG